MRLITAITVLAIATLLIQCRPTTDKRLQTLSNRWKKDQNGCMHIRNKELAVKLLNTNGLMNSSKEAFLIVFGSPNETTNLNGADILTYYYGTICEGNKIVPNGDKCYATFYFKDAKLVSTGFPCE
jgi:hypothetical protein